MTTLIIILATILTGTFFGLVTITIAHDSISYTARPEWLENIYSFIWDNLEKLIYH